MSLTTWWVKFRNNKYFGWAFNISYVIGIIVSIEGGWYGWYFLTTTIILLLLFWKPLIGIMKLGGQMYADWCKAQSYKITKKVYPDYRNPESEKYIKEHTEPEEPPDAPLDVEKTPK